MEKVQALLWDKGIDTGRMYLKPVHHLYDLDYDRKSELFPTALELFRARQWQQAESTLAHCLELLPGDGPSRFYLELCRAYLRKPPAADWQGIIPVGK